MSHLFAPKWNYGRIVALSLFFFFSILILNPKSNAQAVNETDSLALVALYNSTDGANWTDNSNWLTGPVTSWYGITVSDNRVNEISLEGNGLNGTIPSALGNLYGLNSLDMRLNSLSGVLPSELSNLSNLSLLDLDYNSFSGTIPPEYGALGSLSTLSLISNNLEGNIPAQLGNLTNLQYLYLYENAFTAIPVELTACTGLLLLAVNDNELTDLPDFSSLSSLNEFNIKSNHIEFQDIETYMSGGNAATFEYNPQKEVDTEEFIVANPGGEVTFTTDISGTANLYQWYKDGSIMSGETDPILVLSEIINDDAGVYTCQITSEIVAGLTLTTYNKTLEVTDHTIVCGNISEYVSWSTDTVYVNCDVTIMDMGKVTINPGVHVLFAGPYKIRVEGSLQAVGTATDSIWFSPLDKEEGWHGIEVEIYSSSEETFFNYCVFEHGKAGYRSNQAFSGGALFIGSSMMQVSCKSCTFSNNYAEDDGGAIYATGTMVKIDRCSFCNNNCLGDGGAVLLGSNTYPITILNSLFANNESNGKGGGAWLELSATGSAFYNNTFAKNNAAYGGGIYFYESSIDIYNSILYANASTQGGIQVGIETFTNIVPNFYYSDIQAGTIGFYLSGVSTYEGTTSDLLDSDPLFADPAAGPGIMYNGCLADYSLQETSPCINQGDPATSSSLIGEFDILGNDRFDGASIDQGAFERGGTGTFFVDSQVQFPALSYGNSVWLDYDDDGDLDIFYQGESFGQYSSYFYENTETGFSPTELSINGVMGAQASVCDYNLDNQPDIFIVDRHGSVTFSALYQNTGGNFSLVSSTGIVPLQYAGADWADFDNDGDQDLAICGQAEDMSLHCYIYKNTEGSFEVYDDLFGMIYSSVSWQDIDNDGDQDLLAIGNNGSGSRFAKLYKNNAGIFTEVASGIVGFDYASVDWADFNGDGYIDLIITGQSSAAATIVYTNNAGNGFVEYSDGLPNISEGAARFTDFNSDGLIDVFLIGMDGVSGYATQGLYLNNGSGFDNTPSGVLPLTAADVRVADVNQDGKPDMFVMGNDYDAYSMLYLNDSENANTPPSAPVSPTSNVNGTEVELSWGAGDDAETPVVSLTYNLSLKNSAGNLVQSPMATISNGHRKISGNGSNNLALTKTFSCLPGGIYYWRVQSIDQGFSASAFTEEASFEMPDAINIVTQPSDAEVCENGDTLFGLVAEGTNLTYQWQVSLEGWEDLQNDDVYQNVNSDTLRIIGAVSDITETQYRCKITCDCPSEVYSDEVSLIVNGLPTAFNLSGGGRYCAGGTGVEIGLDGSETGVEYTLLLDGSPTSTIVSGTGTAISFGEQTTAGDYTVSALNTATSCSSEMTGTVAVTIDDNPAAFNVTGGGSYCAGGTGVEIGLDGSETGVAYTLVLDGSPTSTIVSGTGTAISFGDQTTAGDYTVSALNTATSCSSEMTGTVAVTIDDNPTAFNVTGGGSYCAGGTGVEIGLDGSETGVAYTLVLDGSPTFIILSGTGTAISFGDQTTAGDYTVSALNTATSCSSEMTGAVAVSIDDNPTAFNVTGGGSYCAGGTGVEIGLDGSETGVAYTLVLDGSPTFIILSGTGTAISFGDQTTAGDYTVSALNTATSCSSEMTGTVAVTIDDNPTAFNVTGGGRYCAGGTGVEIGLDGSETGVAYTLVLDGSPTSTIVSGTGTAISFGDQTTAGDYTVSALNTATSCSSEMTGAVAVTIDDNPTAFNVTGGGSYCAGGTGVEIGLDGSETGVAYTLVLDGSPTSTIVSGTGTAISFGEQTTAGDYTVSALNTATSCSSEMTGAVAVTIDDNPTAFNVTGGGSYCAGGTGVEIGLDGSETGVAYTLVLDGSPTSTIVSGTGTAISFGEQTTAGDYTVSALNTATSCSSEMTGTVAISIDDNPTAFNVTGGGSYCAGGTGVEIGLDGSETGVAYTLVLDGSPTSIIVSGTGTAISFGDQTTAGDYTVSALNTATSCSSEMTGAVAVSIDDNPTAFNVTGGGSYCAGGTGVEIGLDGSETGVAYTLVLDGSPTSIIVSGTGTAISFGDQTTAGDYTVSALNTATSCSSEMTGTVAVTIDDNPTAFNVTGGGSYCAGGTGVEIGLDGSETGVAYTLLLDGTPTSTIVSGTGTSISFGDQTVAGDYTVSALNTATSCSSEMTGTVAVTIDDNPTAFNVTGGGSYCAGGTGVEIGLDGSETGVAYTLLLDGTPTSTIVSGTGTAISFGDQATAGDYTVSALNTATSCSSEMTGTVAVSIDDNPAAFNVTGGGSYCAGGTGVEIGLGGSETGVAYTLVLDGSPTSIIVSGTGTAISFGDQTTAGDYTVSALNTATSCSSEMTGTVAVTIDDNPTAFNVTGGGSYCAGGTGVEIGLDGSETGVAYTLVLDGSPTSTIVSGTGTAISFGDQTTAGDYTVSALNTATSCSSEMTGTVAISIDDNPTAFNVTGGGSYCAGGTGVEIGLDGSETGVAYTLVLDGSPTSTIVSGTGTAISFGDQTTAGDYTVSALNTATSCSSEMTGAVAVSIDDNPTAFNVTGGGSYCAGGTGVEIGLDGSETGVAYTLVLDGSPTSTIVSGTGTAISFGDQTTAGDYTVSALNTATSCSSEMTGTVAVTIDDNPAAFNVTGGGSYCAGGTGVEIGLDGSETGVAYTLLLDGTPTSTIVSGTGTSISFGDQTVAGDYTVSALNTATSCSSEMTGTVAVTIDDNPTAFNVTGGGSYCAGGTGVEIGLDGSETGVAYTLLLDGTPTSTIVSGTGTSISFGDQTVAGDYTVSALNTATSCSSEMTGTVAVTIDDNPTAFNVTGGGSYCAGGTGVEIGLDGSETGVAYTLVLDGSPTSTIVSGTGTAISFGDQTTAGDYTVSALNTATSCSSEMTGAVAVSIDDNPTAFNVTGGGSYCAGGTGVEIGLDGSETGVAYTLVLDGTPTSTIVSGTGTAISFGDQTTAGDYTVSALNTATSCSSEMTGAVAVSIDDNPTAFNVTGGGSYCAGGTGVEIGLDGSETGVAYTLVLDGSPTSTIVSGTGTAISFGDQTTAGDYTVSALNTATSCSSEMTGTVAVTIDDNPTAFNVTGGGSYCAGGTGAEIGLDGSETGVAYTLVLDGTPTSIIVSGTGTAISFGDQTTAGDYTVSALNTATSCSSEMTGTVAVSIDDNPAAFNVTGGGSYCAGGTGVEIGLDGSETGVAYTLLLDGTPTSTIVSGTGTAISFGDQTVAGDYTVSALNTATSCSSEMTGAVAVTIDDNPTAFNVTGGGSYCAGGTGVEIGLDGSETGVAYTLVLDGSPTSIIVSGTGTAISFGDQTTAGDYTVSALNTATSCSSEMTGTVAVIIEPLPEVSFSGLANTYCGNDDPALLSGNQAPEGSFTGLGITDNGDGTAWFDPSVAGAGFHNIEYSYTSPTGCSNQQTSTTEVLEIPLVEFTGLDAAYCENASAVLLTGNQAPEGILSGNGITDNGDGTAWFDPGVAGAGGPYSITYSYTNTDGCSDEDMQEVTVNVLPIVSFTGLDASYCQDDEDVLLTGSEAPEGSFTGDGITDNGDGTATLSFSALMPGADYQVVYSYSDGNSCTGTDAQSWHLNTAPTADYSYSGACFNQEVEFTDLSLANTGNIVSWEWDFGDGNSSTEQSPVHRFESGTGPGFDVQLTVVNDLGCSNTLTQHIVISDPPEAGFTYDVDPPCAGNEVLFTDNSIAGSGSITNWMWDLGDGNSTNGQSFTHIYENEGLYTVELIVLSNTGCSDTIAQDVEIHALPDADFDFTNGCPDQMLDFTDLSSITQGGIVSWEWDFGDGNTSADQNAQHAYTAPGIYNVALKVTSDQGCEHTVTTPLEIYTLPEADFSFGSACSGDDVAFTDQSTGGNYNLVSWMWDFGDGSTSTDQNPAHVFENPGQYDVTLTVSHEFGCSDTKLISVDVHPTPVAAFSWEGVCANHTFAFTDESDPVGGNLISWTWDFGDGTSSTEQNPQHNWLEAGSFEASLTISSENECVSTVSQTVNVGYVPVASFTFQGVCAGNPTVFTDMSSLQQGEINSWLWNFDDGTTSDEQNPEHVFASEGLFAVWLKVTAENSCVDSVQEGVLINPIPDLYLGNDTTICPGGYYLDAGGSYSSYIWSTGANTPGILIEESGWYKLTVEDEFGCGATDSVYVSVLEELELQGRVTTAEEVVNSGFVYLYRYEENTASEKIDSTLIEYGGFYGFSGLNPCDRFIVMAEGDPMFYPDNYPTYYDDDAHWEEAIIIDSTFASVDGVISDIDIELMQYENMGQGAGYLQGFVFYSGGGGAMKGSEERGEPVKNTDISLEMLAEDQKSTDADVFHTTRRTQTDKEGFYMFDFLPTGTFRIVVEIPGLPLDSMYRLTITNTDSVFLDLNYYVDTTSGIYVTPDPSGVEDFVAQKLQLAVRPNPNNGNFTLFFLQEQHHDVWVEEVQIVDMTGSLILQERLGKACRRQIADMRLHDVLPGLYLLNLQTDKGRMMVKIIVR